MQVVTVVTVVTVESFSTSADSSHLFSLAPPSEHFHGDLHLRVNSFAALLVDQGSPPASDGKTPSTGDRMETSTVMLFGSTADVVHVVDPPYPDVASATGDAEVTTSAATASSKELES